MFLFTHAIWLHFTIYWRERLRTSPQETELYNQVLRLNAAWKKCRMEERGHGS
jgi:hypothetical protein